MARATPQTGRDATLIELAIEQAWIGRSEHPAIWFEDIGEETGS